MPIEFDYTPVASFTFHDGLQVHTHGLTVIVGANSCGKTRLLHDVINAARGEEKPKIVCRDIESPAPADVGSLVARLADAGFVKRRAAGTNNEHWDVITPLFGARRNSTKAGSARALEFSKGKVDARKLLHELGSALLTTLLMPDRLQSSSSTSSFEPQSNKPQDDLQTLYINGKAQGELNELIKRQFGKQIHVGNVVVPKSLEIRLIPHMNPISPADTTFAELSKRLRLDDEGDGLRSFVSIAIAVLLGSRPLCLIDEPEHCLHPPQAYAIGKFIGKHASASSNATLVTTHSSHVLRGIISAAPNVKILRLTHPGEHFQGHLVSAEEVQSCLSKPISRKERVFDGVFADAAVVVEAEGDRDVYGCVWEMMEKSHVFDLSFIPVGGTGQLAEPLRFYNTLNVPVAVIADLDLICDIGTFRAIIAQMSTDQLEEILTLASSIKDDLRTITPTNPSECEVKEALSKIANEELSWNANDDGRVVSQLRLLSNRIDRLRSLKKGIRAFSEYPELQAKLTSIVSACKKFGVFLVPEGEVESWCPELMQGVSRDERNKQKWASEAIVRISASPERALDVTEFVAEVDAFLFAKTRMGV